MGGGGSGIQGCHDTQYNEFSIITFSITTLSMMSLSITTPGIIILSITLTKM
jgi:hypothetical protein